jgi:cytochrome P450
LKELLPIFQQKAQKLATYFERQISAEDGVVELVSTYSLLTLDVIGVAALGVNLEDLDTSTSFYEYYVQMFDPPPLGQALLALNAFIPVRWIPLQENQRFARAQYMIRKLLREMIQQRIRDITQGKKATNGSTRKDLLTYMIEEMCVRDSAWTEDELLGHAMKQSQALFNGPLTPW